MLFLKNLDTPYTIIEHFSKEIVAGNSSTDVRIKQIVRRNVEPYREIMVWMASITPVDITQKPFGGFTSHHRNYAPGLRHPRTNCRCCNSFRTECSTPRREPHTTQSTCEQSPISC
jgi:hypothetical protein